MVRVERLEDHLARLVPPTRPTRYLGQQLKGPLAGTKIREIEGQVGTDHPHQGNARKIVSLGNHLGADENVDPAVLQVFQKVHNRPFTGHGVPVHAGHPGIRKQLFHGFLDLFGSHAEQLDLIGTAGRAYRYGGFGKPAVMTAKGIRPLVQGQGDVAVFTSNGLATICADGEGGKAASIEEHQGLVAIVQCFADGLLKRRGDVAADTPIIATLGKIHGLDGRQRLAVDPPGERGGFIFPDGDVVPGLQRRGG